MLIKQEEFYKYIKYERSLSELTCESYKKGLEEFDTFLNSQNIKFEEIDHRIIRAYNASLLQKGNSKRTISQRNSSLRTYYKFLNKNKYYTEDPFFYVERQKLEKKLPEVLSINEIVETLTIKVSKQEEINIRNKAIIHLLYSSGMRASELCNTKLKDLDLDNGIILVTKAKGNKQRLAIINDQAKECLLKYLDIARPLLLKDKINDYLFLNKSGDPLNKRGLENMLNQIGKKMSTPKRIYPHIFRHSFATHLLDGGADLRVIQELLGHESLTATQVYTHISTSTLQETYLSSHPHAKINKK